MELRHLRYFVTVADEMSFRRAALSLHVSQPPLSRQIRDLEEELGTKLFERTRQKLVLTPAGEAFLKEARQILSHAQRAAAVAKAASRGEAGRLSIAILPPAIRQFRKRYPAVDLSVVDLSPQEQITALLDQRIDLGFVPLPITNIAPELHYESVREIELLVALPPGHRLAKLRCLNLPKLAAEPFVLIERSSATLLHDWVLNLCRDAGFEPHSAKFARSPLSVLELVSAGFGVSILPSLFQRYPADVVFRLLPNATPRLHLALTWRRDNTSPLLEAFLNTLRPMLNKI